MTDNLPTSGGLAAALARAIARSHAVAKDATNQHQRYDYASAEAVLSEARAALGAEGLAVVPAASAVEWTGTATDDKGREHPVGILRRQYAIVCGSEAMTASQEWPVICSAGRPADKAAASALTTSLAYWLRDLLLLPRLGEHQMDRDAPEPAPRRETPKPKAEAAPTAPTAQRSPEALRAAKAISDIAAALGLPMTEKLPVAGYISCDRAGTPRCSTLTGVLGLPDEDLVQAAVLLDGMGANATETAQRWADERKAARAAKGK